MVAEIDDVRKNGDTLGGVIEVVVHGLPPGLGSHVHWDRRLDSRLAGALMGVQSVKAVEVGDGLETARRRGSVAHDEIDADAGRAAVQRRTDRAGGIEGGMTNGEVLRVRAAMKPISTVPRALATVDTATLEPAVAINQRSDACAVPRGSVVMEAMVALVLADAVLEKFGGDSVTETRRNVAGLPRRAARSDEHARCWCWSARRRRARRPSARRWPTCSGVGLPGHRPRHRGRGRLLGRRPVRRRRARTHFRALEEQAVARALAEHDGVLALGGGAVTQRRHPRAAGRPTAATAAPSSGWTSTCRRRPSGSGSPGTGRSWASTRGRCCGTCSRPAPRSTARSRR